MALTLRHATRHGHADARHGGRAAVPDIRPMRPAEIAEVLRRGAADFAAFRTDVVFLCLIYPVIGLVLARAILYGERIEMLFPVASGFALVGPFLAVGLFEMSRRRERGETVRWSHALGVFRAPGRLRILGLGLVLMAVFLLWLIAAQAIYAATMGPAPPDSARAFLAAVFTTGAGWAMIVLGLGVGALFAVVALSISVVSFPLLLDRDIGIDIAVRTSLRAVTTNPAAVAAWGLVVAAGLVAGTLPAFVGLAIVMPVLGHATWHLYRRLVVVP